MTTTPQSRFKQAWRKINAPLDWQDQDAEITSSDVHSIPSEEQETVLCWMRRGVVDVYSSDSVEITKLRRNPALRVQRITLNRTGRVITVQGTLPAGNITIRTKEWPSDE